jgi:hypothetical protein
MSFRAQSRNRRHPDRGTRHSRPFERQTQIIQIALITLIGSVRDTESIWAISEIDVVCVHVWALRDSGPATGTIATKGL